MQDIVIGPELLPCYGLGPNLCMYVRPYGSPIWDYFDGEIEGFVFEPGFDYLIRVERTLLKNPPAGGSMFRFVLIDIIRKTPVSPPNP